MDRNGNGTAPDGDLVRRRPLTIAVRRDRSLAQGMAIAASIEVRLLRFRLLSLDATIDAVPAEPMRSGGDVARPAERPRRRANDRRDRAGAGLAAASRSLEASSLELRSARDQMP